MWTLPLSLNLPYYRSSDYRSSDYSLSSLTNGFCATGLVIMSSSMWFLASYVHYNSTKFKRHTATWIGEQYHSDAISMFSQPLWFKKGTDRRVSLINEENEKENSNKKCQDHVYAKWSTMTCQYQNEPKSGAGWGRRTQTRAGWAEVGQEGRKWGRE